METGFPALEKVKTFYYFFSELTSWRFSSIIKTHFYPGLITMIHFGLFILFFLLLYIHSPLFPSYLQSPKPEFQIWNQSAAVFLFAGIAVE